MSSYQLTVNLVIYNGAAWLPWCLESILNQTYQKFFLLIIDNGSIDNSYQTVADFITAHPTLIPRSRLVRNKQNLGFARGHNQALAWTESDYVMVLNQDVYLSPDYLRLLIESLTNNERAAAISGKILFWPFEPNNFHPSQFSQLKTVYIDSVGLLIKRNRQVINWHQGEPDRGQFISPRPVFGVPATACLYRRQALREISPDGEVWDEDFVSYKEDVDLTWRLNLAGYESWLQPQAVAYHDRSLAGGRNLLQEYRQRRNRAGELKIYSWVNHWCVLIKNDSLFNLVRDLPWIFGHELAKFLFLLFTDPLVLTKGLLRLIKLFPKFWQKRRLLHTTHQISYSQLRKWWSGIKVK